MSAGESDQKFIKEAANQLNGLLTEMSGFVSVLESLLRSTSEGKELLPMMVGTLDRASALTQKLQAFIYEKEGHGEAVTQLLNEMRPKLANLPQLTDPGSSDTQSLTRRMARIQLGPMRQVVGPATESGAVPASPADLLGAAADAPPPALSQEPMTKPTAPATGEGVEPHQAALNPPASSTSPGSRPTRSVDPGLMGNDELIMVVDDEKNILMLVEMMLKSANYRLLKANSGEEALVLFDEHADHIALTILDFTMEGMNGRDVFLRIIEKQPEARVLMSSGYAEASALKEMLAKGLRGYIPKPYSRDRLLFQVKSVLSN